MKDEKEKKGDGQERSVLTSFNSLLFCHSLSICLFFCCIGHLREPTYLPPRHAGLSRRRRLEAGSSSTFPQLKKRIKFLGALCAQDDKLKHRQS